MALVTVLVALMLTAPPLAAKSIPSFAGPYVMYLEKLSPCSDNDTNWRDFYGGIKASHFKPNRPHEPQILNGVMNLNLNVDDSYRFSALVHKRANNQWKRNYFVFNNFPVGTCSALRDNLPSALHKVFKIKNTGRCIAPKGAYTFDHVPVTWFLPNFPQLPYGYYFIQIKGERLREDNYSSVAICGEGGVLPKP